MDLDFLWRGELEEGHTIQIFLRFSWSYFSILVNCISHNQKVASFILLNIGKSREERFGGTCQWVSTAIWNMYFFHSSQLYFSFFLNCISLIIKRFILLNIGSSREESFRGTCQWVSRSTWSMYFFYPVNQISFFVNCISQVLKG